MEITSKSYLSPLSTPKTGATGAKAAKTAGGNLDNSELNALERLIDKDNPDEPGFTVYDDIREKLVARGIPREQIAFILSLIHI